MNRIIVLLFFCVSLAGCAAPVQDSAPGASSYEAQRFSQRIDAVRAAMLSALMKADLFVEHADSLGTEQRIVGVNAGRRAVVELERLGDGATLARVQASDPASAAGILSAAERMLQ